ncbi:MAG: RNA polymerase sigma factor [Clostridia bacterium]|nr:RNA polymerase sigma factor [Clostridia bacterium]
MEYERERVAELLKQLKDGNQDVFEEFYKLTSPRAYFIALKIVRNEHDAEDILQESYIKLLEKINEINPDRNFSAWFYKVVANKSKDFLKKQNLLVFEGEDEEIIDAIPEEDPSFSPEESLDQDELCNEVMAAIDELTAEKRACIMMMYFGEMSVSEIAESLEVPISTVKNRLFNARKDLKSKFEKQGSTVLYSAAPVGVVAWALGKSAQTVSATFAASAASAEILAGVGAAGSLTVAASSTAGAAATTAAASTAATASATTTAATTAAATAAASTGAAASTAAATGAGVAAKIAALSVAQKVVVGAVAAGVVGGSTAGVATVAKNISPPETTTSYIVEEITTAPSQTKNFLFAWLNDDEEGTTAQTEAVTQETTEATTLRREPTATFPEAEETKIEEETDAETEKIETDEETQEVKTKAPSTRRDYSLNRTTSKINTTTKKVTTTSAKTTTQPATEELTAEEETTEEETTTRNVTATKRTTTTKRVTTTVKPTATKAVTTTKRVTTTAEATTEKPTTTVPPTTTEPTTQVPATLVIEVTDFENNVVATITETVEAGTEITRDYLVSLVSSKGYEAMAGVYGDAIGSVAESGQTYNFTAEL